jgi:hypothetical protein
MPESGPAPRTLIPGMLDLSYQCVTVWELLGLSAFKE